MPGTEQGTGDAEVSGQGSCSWRAAVQWERQCRGHDRSAGRRVLEGVERRELWEQEEEASRDEPRRQRSQRVQRHGAPTAKSPGCGRDSSAWSRGVGHSFWFEMIMSFGSFHRHILSPPTSQVTALCREGARMGGELQIHNSWKV